MKKHIRFDWAMKRLLRNKANFDILEGFLSELLKQDINILEILESESNQEHETDKFNRVDNLNKDQKELYERYVKIKRIQENEIKSARFDGRLEAENEYLPKVEAERKEKEEAQKREEAARNNEKEMKKQKAKMMLSYNEPEHKICEQTNFRSEEIALLKKEMNNNL